MTKHMPVQTRSETEAPKGTRAAIFQLWAEKGRPSEIPKDPSLFSALPETRHDKTKPIRLAQLCQDVIEADSFEFWD